MAATNKPTNEHLVEMLTRIVDDLEDLKANQARIAADVAKLANQQAK